MTFDQTIELIRSNDVGGLLNNQFDDFLFQHRHDTDLGVCLGSALLKLRRLARGQNVAIDANMVDAAEMFADWMEVNR